MEGEANNNICPKCQHINPDEVTHCQLCGTELKPTTLPVKDMVDAQSATLADDSAPGQKPAFRGIALWVRNHPRPLIVDAQKGAILGRKVSDEDAPTLIDLTEHNAYKLGVSRRHAQLDCTGQGCLLIDLGSSNGTWVNGLRLQPYQPAVLKSGDRVYLARLEMIVGPLSDEALQRARYIPTEDTSRTPTDVSPWAEASGRTTNSLGDKFLEQPITEDVAESAAKAVQQAESALPAAQDAQEPAAESAAPDKTDDAVAPPSPAEPPKLAAPEADAPAATPGEDAASKPDTDQAQAAPAAEQAQPDTVQPDQPAAEADKADSAAKTDDAVIELPAPPDKARLAAPQAPAPDAQAKPAAPPDNGKPARKDAQAKPAVTTDDGKPPAQDTKREPTTDGDDTSTETNARPGNKNGAHDESA